jgi:predicted RNA-binding protein YlqC (UPF0109 family)
MKELIEYSAKSLVDNPEEASVTEPEGEQTSVIELRVAKEDMGKIIGKQGRTAMAMRTMLSAASTKMKKRSVLEILEQLSKTRGYRPDSDRIAASGVWLDY